ncbi:MAG: ISL3 family transposase, partial [Gammaproteobacteria bacterium]|nr:ISL3 family transposase [Gammaproteobacteria bacterium]
LGLSDVTVVGVRTNLSAHKIIISVKSTREEVSCRLCGRPTKKHGVGRELHLRHLPILGQETFIEIIPRRGKCEHCEGGPTTTELLDWYEMNSKFTKPFEHRMLFELVNSTVADVSRKEGIDYHTVEALIDRYVETDIDYSHIESLDVLGLDEISLKKGYKDYVTLITYRSHEHVKLLGVVKGREKSNIITFLSHIPPHLRKSIRAVCCDLYDGYIQACEEAFEKKIPVVADRFHVRRLYRKSLISLRKSELVRLKKELTPEKYSELKPAITLLRKEKDYFLEEEKSIVEQLFWVSPKLKQGYQLSRELTGIFDSDIPPDIANNKISEWINSVNESKLTCFNSFIKTLIKYQQHISNYFMDRDTSGFVEGFNNKVKVLKRRCYGLSNITKLFQRLIIDTLGMERFAFGVG